jgi:hypothetical protein
MQLTRPFASAQPRTLARILEPMTIRRFQQQRFIAWMALAAILLLSIVPTVSQLVASAMPHADRGQHGAGHAAVHIQHFGHPLASHHGKGHDDDCWTACGYCNFLAQTPALGTIGYVAAFAPTLAPAPIDRACEPSRQPNHPRAAQPRGPPAFLA